jgi:hypothetical protein
VALFQPQLFSVILKSVAEWKLLLTFDIKEQDQSRIGPVGQAISSVSPASTTPARRTVLPLLKARKIADCVAVWLAIFTQKRVEKGT